MKPDEHLTVIIAPVSTGNFVSVKTLVHVAGIPEHSSEISRFTIIDNDTVKLPSLDLLENCLNGAKSPGFLLTCGNERISYCM